MHRRVAARRVWELLRCASLSRATFHLAASLTLLACQPAVASAPPAAPTVRAGAIPPAPTSPVAVPASAPAPAASSPGEHPALACAAQHPVAALPLGSVNVDDWADAIAKYRPQANGGRPVAWEGAESEVLAYLDAVHACVHVAFADSFLRSLASLPKDHPLSDPELAATVELVIDGDSGRLAEIGVVASSGVPEFDAAAVAAFGRAFPLAPPPAASLSSDERLYVTWELRRRPEDACKREQARPWKLRF
jgi:TonB family protein